MNVRLILYGLIIIYVSLEIVMRQLVPYNCTTSPVLNFLDVTVRSFVWNDGVKKSLKSEKTTSSECILTEMDETSKTVRMRSKIVMIGDSITQQSFSAELSGFGAYLADIYQRRADVFNRGFSGYNTDWLLHYLANTEEGKEDVFSLKHVGLVTIFMGANDASCEKNNPRHHVPVERFQNNLRSIISLCRQHFGQDVRIIIIGAPPVHHPSRLEYQIQRFGKNGATGVLERTLKLSGEHAAAAGSVAKQENLPFLNVWEEMLNAVPRCSDPQEEAWSEFLSDGLHLSAKGNLFVGKKLQTLIETSFPEFAVIPDPKTGFPGTSGSSSGTSIDFVAPWHDQIDHKKSEKAFDDRYP